MSSDTKSSYVSNGDKRFKITDIDQETLESGAEGYVVLVGWCVSRRDSPLLSSYI